MHLKGTLYDIDSSNGGTYDDDRDQNDNDMMRWRLMLCNALKSTDPAFLISRGSS